MTTLTASTGCDSIITLDLTMSTSAATSETVEMCDSYTWATNGTTYTSSGSFTETLTSSTGCDSIVTLNLTINGSSTNAPEVVSACDSYTWAEDGNTYTSSGNYTLGLTTINGCDSTLTLDLTISNSYSNTEVVTACNSYTWAGDGNTYTASGNYNVVLTNAQGCDSSLTLDLTIENINNGITYQDSVTLAATENGASYVWLDCNDNYSIVQGANGQNFAPLANGSYAVEVTLNGCVDTSDCMTISKVEIIESDFGTYLNLYPNPTFGDLTIDLGKEYAEVKLSVTDAAGRLIQELSVLNSTQIAMKLTGEPGVYFLSLESSEGSQVTLRVVKE
jgi:hypothetical protein